MGLLDDLAAETVVSTTRCPVAALMRDMDPQDSKDLQQAFEDLSYTGVLISKVLRNRGFNVSDRAVQNHRRKSCSCRS